MDRTYSNSAIQLNTIGGQHLPALLANCASQYPSNIALKFDDTAYTYHDLNSTVNQFAHFLLANKLAPDDCVAVALDRSPQMLISLLATIKSGAAYLPLDPDYPKDRIEYMLHDSGTRFLITSKKYEGHFTTNATPLYIEDVWPALASQQTTEPNVALTGSNLAYILYTSGSTGKPKGVAIEHHSFTNLLLSIQKQPGITNTDTLLSVTTISFDIAAVELFVPLISGATLILTDSDTAKDSRELLKIMQGQNVTVMQATPGRWSMLLDSGWDAKLPIKAFCGGEPLTNNLANSILAKCSELWNMYAPTETTIYSIIKKVSVTDEVITIGNPIDNTVVYLLNESEQEVDTSDSGEICIGGEGVARGYLNQPQLTQEKFITFKPANGQPVRLYKTGDLGKLLPSGEIQCFGRIDNQVKISGYRIELGEIENVIQSSGLVAQTAVVTRETRENDKNLVAYATPNAEYLRLKEKELYIEQVKSWEKVYDAEYDHAEHLFKDETDSQFNTKIWKDSFTAKPIPANQMQEWLDDIVDVVLAQKPKNVLELGCGTGLIYYKIAPHINKYIGTDFSRAGITALNDEVNKDKEKYPETQLMVCAAHETAVSTTDEIDTVIINSVIQYFPGEDYLSEVIANSVALLNGHGKIIIGDVRDLRLLNLFKSHLFLLKVPPQTDKKEFAYIVDQEVMKEEELCVSPEYFYKLKSLYPQISYIDIQWKQGEHNNELFSYRYTVVIHIGCDKSAIKPEWIKWTDSINIQSIKAQLQDGFHSIAISDVPNPRLSRELLLEKGTNDRSINTTGELFNYILKPTVQSIQVTELIQLAKKQGYYCKFFVNKNALKYNLLFTLQPGNDHILPNYKVSDSVAVTNIPLLSSICNLIQRNIYKELSAKLPAFMVPANLIILNKMPLTENGKIDRLFLKNRQGAYRSHSYAYRQPRNDIERKLIVIWQDLLGIEKISIDDNFFELGGNSLIAIRMMISMEKETGKDLPLSALFEFPTIESLAAIIQNTNTVKTSRCLVRLKPEGNRTPLYIIHGWGLTVFIFNDITKRLHPDQPVFALQGIGVDGTEEPLTKVEDIAARYISEILEQNPTGPYAFAGYSLGGVIACEIAKQLRIMGKTVTMMAMFDAYAHTSEKRLSTNIMNFSFKKINKFLLRLSHNIVQLIKDPNSLNEKFVSVSRKMPRWLKKSKVGQLRKDNDVDFYSNELSKIYFNAAVKNYHLTAQEDTIELFRGSKNIYYYMDDPIYLGWHQYAKTVNLHRLKGTHTTMFLPPNDKQFAEILQQCLDKAGGVK